MPWNKEELKLLKSLDDPDKIQGFLDSISYNPGYNCKSPRGVISKRSAHCMEGALFAAAALEFLGYEPLILDMKSENDDDHVIAVFKNSGLWGAVAKSNFTLLRYREPVYRTVRELVMSYFDFCFNVDGYKSFRSYSRPFNLKVFERRNWKTTEEDLEYIGDKIESLHHYPVAPPESIKKLFPASPSLIEAGLIGSNPAGLYKPS